MTFTFRILERVIKNMKTEKYKANFSNGGRYEIRFSVVKNGLNEVNKVSGFKKVDYPFPYTTTIYFGSVNKKTKQPHLFRNLKIRARFYTRKPMGDYFIVDDKQPCLLEVKIDKRVSNISIKNKARLGSVDGDSKISSSLEFGQIVEAMLDPDKLSEIVAHLKHPTPTIILEEFVRKRLGQLRPLGATCYRRTHYASGRERVTHDKDIKFYLSVHDDIGRSNYIFYKIAQPSDEILEIKKDLSDDISSQLVSKLLAKGCKVIKIKDGKGTKLRKILRSNERKKVNFPSTVAAGSKSWDWAENEVKIDLDNIDPRPFVENFKPRHPWIIGNIKREVKYLKFYLTPDEKISICKMFKSLKPYAKSKLKVKKFLYSKGGALVRNENVVVFSSQGIAKALKENGIKKASVNVSPIIYEYRIFKYLFNPNTGNLFRLYADHCTVPKESFGPLDQIEIESMGTITPLNNQTPLSIARDQSLLTKIILDDFKGKVRTYPGVTKSLWIKKHVGYV